MQKLTISHQKLLKAIHLISVSLAISPDKAVQEMLDKLKKNQKEIKIGSVGILHYLSRIAPDFAMKKVNSY